MAVNYLFNYLHFPKIFTLGSVSSDKCSMVNPKGKQNRCVLRLHQLQHSRSDTTGHNCHTVSFSLPVPPYLLDIYCRSFRRLLEAGRATMVANFLADLREDIRCIISMMCSHNELLL